MDKQWLEKVISLENKHALHMRPAQRIVETACKFKSDVHVCKDAHDFNAKSILDMIEFAAHMVSHTEAQDKTFIFKSSGDDAEAALKALSELIDNKFGLE